MKLKNIAVASAFIAGNLCYSTAAFADYTYQLLWQDSSSNQLTGSITFNTLSIPVGINGVGGSSNALPSYVSGGAITVGNTVYTNFSGIIARVNSATTLDTTNTNFLSQFSDINFFTSGNGGGTCSTLSTPQGVQVNTVRTCVGTTQTLWTLVSMIYGSGSGSVDLAPNAYALRSSYNIQSAALNAGLSYDCNVFDKEGFCLSTGGRYSVVNSPETNTTSGLLIGSYKYDKNIRLGAWVDQNLSTQNPDGVKLSNNDPMFGVFGVWSERNDGLGYEVKVSAGYGDKDLTVTRSSANAGTSQLRMRGVSTVSSFGLPVEGGLIAAPYVGFKYLSINRAGYTEGGSSALTYDGLHQESTTVVAGAKLSGKIDAETSFAVSAGLEHDLENRIGQYSAGSSNTTVFNSNVQKTRPVVSAGVYYDIDKTQRVGLNATVRQEAFQSVTSTSALATYTVGF